MLLYSNIWKTKIKNCVKTGESSRYPDPFETVFGPWRSIHRWRRPCRSCQHSELTPGWIHSTYREMWLTCCTKSWNFGAKSLQVQSLMVRWCLTISSSCFEPHAPHLHAQGFQRSLDMAQVQSCWGDDHVHFVLTETPQPTHRPRGQPFLGIVCNHVCLHSLDWTACDRERSRFQSLYWSINLQFIYYH